MKKNTAFSFIAALIAVAITYVGCSKEEQKISDINTSDYQQFAQDFTEALAAREYANAYTMTSHEYRKQTSVEQLQTAFEIIVPKDWGQIGPIEVIQTLTAWPAKRREDLGWVYVSIGGDVYSEAITVIVTSENGEAKIREVELGRP